jgi:DNA-binding protein YbaB
MEEQRNNPGQNLGVAALITAIITLVIAVIPCVGVIAIIPGIIAIVLASVGISRSSGSNSQRGLLISGLIIGILAAMISLSQLFFAGKLMKHAEMFPKHIENIVREVEEDVLESLDEGNVSIKVESDGNKVEINDGAVKKDQEKTLEDLENESNNDTVAVK